MKIIGIDHIAITSSLLEKDSSFWHDILGISYKGKVVLSEEGVITRIYDTGNGKVELLSEFGENSPISKFIKERGTGLHHICFEVEDIFQAIEELKQKDIELINDSPDRGAEGYLIIFIHPQSTGGVLVELCQKNSH